MQVPPNTPSSTMATRQSSSSGVTSELPEPVPTITRSKCGTHSTVVAFRSPAGDRFGHQVADEVLVLDAAQAARGEPLADVAAVAREVVDASRVGEQVDHLRQVDQDEAAAMHEH